MKQKISWELTDEFWEAVADLLIQKPQEAKKTYHRGSGGGRKPMDFRLALAGILYVLRTGCQWKALSKEFGATSLVHRYFQLWTEKGVFLAMWRRGLHRYDELQGIAWEWQSVDESMVKAPEALESVGPNPTDRGKKRDEAACFG
jgi:transposase